MTFARSIAAQLIIGAVVMMTVVMTASGAFYVSRFSNEIDARIREQIQAPGRLMNDGLLNFEAFTKPETMRTIVGDDLTEALIIGFDETVYYSMRSGDIGRTVDQLGRVDLKEFRGETESLLIRDSDQDGRYIAAITPITPAFGQAAFLFSYLKIRTEEIERQKATLVWIFLFGTALSVAILSAGIYLLFRMTVLVKIRKLRDAAELVGRGRLGSEVTRQLPESEDELGDLAAVFGQMVSEVKKARTGLQAEVDRQTKDLSVSKAELAAKVGELEKANKELGRMNEIMVGRELKMIELKKALDEKTKKK